MTTRVEHLTPVCDYASCTQPPTTRDGWVFCAKHYAAHLALMAADRGQIRTFPNREVRRELVEQLHAQGLTDPAIAAELGVTVKAVIGDRKARSLPSNFRRTA